MKLFRRWLATSAPIPEMSAERVAQYLGRAAKPDQFVVFDLPAKNAFAQVKRMKPGGLQTLGQVTLVEDYGFPSVNALPGDDGRVAAVVAQALALLAAGAGVANIARVRAG